MQRVLEEKKDVYTSCKIIGTSGFSWKVKFYKRNDGKNRLALIVGTVFS
jgi:hypothetical protein